MTEDVSIRIEGGVGHITLTRPSALHALNTPMCAAILGALKDWINEPVAPEAVDNGVVLVIPLGDAGAAVIIDESMLSADVLAGQLREWLASRDGLLARALEAEAELRYASGSATVSLSVDDDRGRVAAACYQATTTNRSDNNIKIRIGIQ